MRGFGIYMVTLGGRAIPSIGNQITIPTLRFIAGYGSNNPHAGSKAFHTSRNSTRLMYPDPYTSLAGRVLFRYRACPRGARIFVGGGICGGGTRGTWGGRVLGGGGRFPWIWPLFLIKTYFFFFQEFPIVSSWCGGGGERYNQGPIGGRMRQKMHLGII